VRAFRAVGGEPVFIERGAGSHVFGADGREYIDYVGSWGPAILGHAHPAVVRAVQEQAYAGLARRAHRARGAVRRNAPRPLPEPRAHALRIERHGGDHERPPRGARFTGRDLVVKFDGAYHGHVDSLLVRAGSGAMTFGHPDSAGVPVAMAETTLSLPYNDLGALRRLFAANGPSIAAVIVEPVAGNMGCVPPVPGFLAGLIELAEEHGALAIFDEVMTGCRVAWGGAQELYDLAPHLTCLGKIVGGGLPLAVYGGRQDVMLKVAPLGPVYQAGTLSGNPIAVTAGLTTLAELTGRSIPFSKRKERCSPRASSVRCAMGG